MRVTIGAVAELHTPTDGNGESADKKADVARATPTPVPTPTVPMAIRRSESAERRQREHEKAQQPLNQALNMYEPDPLGLALNIRGRGGALYNAPSNYDGITSEDLRVTSGMLWFSRATAQANSASGFAQLGMNVWDGQFY